MLIAVLSLVAGTAVAAEPRANSVEECMIYADLALVASTLAKHGITKDQTSAMIPDMYELATGDAKEIASRIVAIAYGPGLGKITDPKSFAAAFGNMCVRSGGRMDALLGTSL
jgi:hypothetical protein